MSKKNVLGSDPFEWLKGDDKKKDTDNQKKDISGQKKKKQAEKSSGPVVDNKETGAKQEVKLEAKGTVAEPVDVSATSKPLENNIYESVKIAEPYRQQEEETFESSDVSEVNRKAVLGQDVYAHHAKSHKAKSRKTTQKDSPATAFVIVYTVLLLILGFIIYKDLTRQIDRLETKLELIEKKLDAGVVDYGDTEPDRW